MASRSLRYAVFALPFFLFVCNGDDPGVQIEDHIASVEPCKHGDEVVPYADKLCLNVQLSNVTAPAGGPALVFFFCMPYEADRSTPNISTLQRDRGIDDTSHGIDDYCQVDGDKVCTFFLEGLKNDTTYYVFCSGAIFDSYDDEVNATAFNVHPQCEASSEEPCGVKIATGDEETEAEEEEQFGSGAFTGVLLLLMYIFWSYIFAAVENKGCLHYIRILHETGFTVIAGLVGGVILDRVFDKEVAFEYEIFGYFVLPLVIFAAGFNLHKQDFFKYAPYIVGLGIMGTMFIFLYIYWLSSYGEFYTTNGDKIEFSDKNRLMLAAVLSSTDSVAPMAFLPAEVYPSVFSVVFGEGVFNDVVCILLTESTAEIDHLEVSAVAEISANIAKMVLLSSLMGCLFGFGTSLLFKHISAFRDGVLKPTVVMILSNYLCYVCTELLEFSSILSLFICAVICGHYAAFSMTHAGRTFAEESAEMLAYLSEAFVFGYFGVTGVPLIIAGNFSPALIGVYSGSIVLARLSAIIFLRLVMRCLTLGHQLSLGFSEFFVIGFSGCMRGTIAYALILKNTPEAEEQNFNDKCMVSTVLGIVLINCLIFGGLFPLVIRLVGLQPASEGASKRDLVDGVGSEIQMPLSFHREDSAPGADAAPDDPGRSGSGSGSRRVLNQVSARRDAELGQLREKAESGWYHFDAAYLQPVFRHHELERNVGRLPGLDRRLPAPGAVRRDLSRLDESSEQLDVSGAGVSSDAP